MNKELEILSDYNISEGDFASKYPHKINDEYILQFLDDLYQRRDRKLMEDMSRIAFRISSFDKLSSIFRKLITETWHKEHEDLATFFEFTVRDINCIDDIITAMHIKCDYWYDDGDAFIRKCAYVLGNLATPYAIKRLEELTKDDNEIIKKYAHYQLEKLSNREK